MTEHFFSAETRNRMEVGYATEKSPRHERNEDALLIDADNDTLGVCDGLGGHNAGEIASNLAASVVLPDMRTLREDAGLDEQKSELKNILEIASREIRSYSRKNPEYEGMGTTVVVAKVLRKNGIPEQLLIGHVGDSRAYILKGNGEFKKLTRDDSTIRRFPISDADQQAIEEMLDYIRAEDELDQNPRLAEFTRKAWNERSALIQCLGSEEIFPDVTVESVASGDRVLIISDGIYSNLRTDEIEEIMRRGLSPTDTAALLLAFARAVMAVGKDVNFRSHADDASAVVALL